MAAEKDIIYIDIDDEITGIIEKVQSANHQIVALVLPKRAAVLQSIVNMKLLKRSGDAAKKHIVLITSEAGLMPLAGAVGLHVAKTLQTKPVIPTAPKIYDSTVSVDEDEATDVPDKPIDARKPIGVLAGVAPDDEDETIEVDNTEDKEPAELEEPVKKPANKKLKVPDFHKFRTRLFLGGGGLILVLILWYFAAFVMPAASVIIKTNTSEVTSTVVFTTDPKATELDLEKKIVPSTVEVLKKTDSEKATATGEQNKGTKATGTMTLKNCVEKDGTVTISAGSILSASGKNFVTDQAVTLPASTFTGGGSCQTATKTVGVTAQTGGAAYNLAAQSYSLAGVPDVIANGSAMTGGTDKLLKVLSQADFDAARKKIEDRTNSEVKAEMAKSLDDKGYLALDDSLIVGTPEFASTPKVGEEATEATVTSSITYTMIGVKKDDLNKLISDSVKDQIDQNNQMVQSSGIDNAVIRLSDKQPDGKSTANLQSQVVVGPSLDIGNLKKEIAGKKRGQAQSILSAHSGVKDVQINTKPFWVYSVPGKTSKITITLEQATTNDK